MSAQYNTLLASRRSELAGILPPGPDAMPDAWTDFRSKKLLRLLPGDDGFVAWCQAKLAFIDTISMAVRVVQDFFIIENEDDPANGDAETGQPARLADVNYPSDGLVELLLADFPFVPEEI